MEKWRSGGGGRSSGGEVAEQRWSNGGAAVEKWRCSGGAAAGKWRGSGGAAAEKCGTAADARWGHKPLRLDATTSRKKNRQLSDVSAPDPSYGFRHSVGIGGGDFLAWVCVYNL